MNEDEVVKLMKSSTSEKDWNKNAATVKRSCDGMFPDFWYKSIIQSGLMSETTMSWYMPKKDMSDE